MHKQVILSYISDYKYYFIVNCVIYRRKFPVKGTNMYANYLIPDLDEGAEGSRVRASSDNIHVEKVLNDSIVNLKKILMMHHAGEMSHDMDAVRRHIEDRSKEVIDEELTRITGRLVHLQGPNPSHRIAAYAQLYTQLLEETEMVIFNEERRNGELLRLEGIQRKMEADRMQHMLAQKLAAKEQTVASLASDRVELEGQVRALLRSNESLKHELGKLLQEQTHTHQHAVELRMQGLDYKAEVERRCERVLRSIQSRMGFIPAGVMKNIQHLRTLKAPGDPAYDTIRRFAYREAFRARDAAQAGHAARAANPVRGGMDDDEDDEDEDEAADNGDGGTPMDDSGGAMETIDIGRLTLESDSPPDKDGLDGGSSPSIRASGGLASKWAEMIYEADGRDAGWSEGGATRKHYMDNRMWETDHNVSAPSSEDLGVDVMKKQGTVKGGGSRSVEDQRGESPSMGRLRYGSR